MEQILRFVWVQKRLFQRVGVECEKIRLIEVLVSTEGMHSVRVSAEERSCCKGTYILSRSALY